MDDQGTKHAAWSIRHRALLGSSLAVLLLVSACGGDRTVFVPAPPDVEGAGSVLAFVSAPDGVLAYAASAPFDALLLPVRGWSGEVPEYSVLTLHFYRESLEALGVAEGEVQSGLDAERSCGLETPLAIYLAPLQGGSPGPWELQSAPSDHYLDFMLGGARACLASDLCVPFRALTVRLSNSKSAEQLLGLDESTVLVGDLEGQFWRVGMDGSVATVPELSGAPSRSIYQDADGLTWLGGQGRVLRGHLGADFETLPLDEDVSVTSFSRDQASGELLAAAVRSSSITPEKFEQVILLRLEGDAWTTVGTLDVAEAEADHTRVRFVGAGDALMTYGGPSLLHWDGRVLRDQIVGYVSPFFNVQVYDVASHPDIGAVFSANDGRLYRAGPPYDAWVAVAETDLGTEAQVVVPYRSGFLFGGINGRLGQYYPGGRPCPGDSLAASDIEEMVVFPGGEVAVTGGRFGDAENAVTWLIPRD
ncbi:MAG: hypothetical protein KC933_03000 [Myxococcales bacterium]|nr:hypothetical protein [Myxococcales bacterium]MCB9649327.1 hypothetical protein [Deltaproteobacteria bacterium]